MKAALSSLTPEGEPLDHCPRLNRPRPVLTEKGAIASPQHDSQRQADDDRIVELTCNRHEIRNQVDRHRQISDKWYENELTSE